MFVNTTYTYNTVVEVPLAVTVADRRHFAFFFFRHKWICFWELVLGLIWARFQYLFSTKKLIYFRTIAISTLIVQARPKSTVFRINIYYFSILSLKILFLWIVYNRQYLQIYPTTLVIVVKHHF